MKHLFSIVLGLTILCGIASAQSNALLIYKGRLKANYLGLGENIKENVEMYYFRTLGVEEDTFAYVLVNKKEKTFTVIETCDDAFEYLYGELGDHHAFLDDFKLYSGFDTDDDDADQVDSSYYYSGNKRKFEMIGWGKVAKIKTGAPEFSEEPFEVATSEYPSIDYSIVYAARTVRMVLTIKGFNSYMYGDSDEASTSGYNRYVSQAGASMLTLRLDQKRTRNANKEESGLEGAVGDLIESLEDKGYEHSDEYSYSHCGCDD